MWGECGWTREHGKEDMIEVEAGKHALEDSLEKLPQGGGLYGD